VTVTGSPPRVLGAPANRWSAESTAHPHVRGEDCASGARPGPSCGSPPRAWGGRIHVLDAQIAQRLTPTCVGRTDGRGQVEVPAAAHPHVRGEDAALGCASLLARGSPPRAWGGQHEDDPERGAARLTPTCVGRTTVTLPPETVVPAHPHVRGEDAGSLRMRATAAGSPPRAWGGQ